METLNQDIKSGNFKRFYLLFGEEEFLKQSYKKRLRQAVAGDDTMNYNYFEGKGLDVRELISLANTMPFFSDRRLIMVEDSGFFKDLPASGKKEKINYFPKLYYRMEHGLLYIRTEITLGK